MGCSWRQRTWGWPARRLPCGCAGQGAGGTDQSGEVSGDDDPAEWPWRGRTVVPLCPAVERARHRPQDLRPARNRDRTEYDDRPNRRHRTPWHLETRECLNDYLTTKIAKRLGGPGGDAAWIKRCGDVCQAGEARALAAAARRLAAQPQVWAGGRRRVFRRRARGTDLMLDVEGVNYNTCPAYVDSDERYYRARAPPSRHR